MRANNRLPGFIGDLRSQVGAAQLGAARLQEIAGHRGADDRPGRGRPTPSTTRAAGSPRRSSGWPDGTYEADIYVDSDPQGNRTSTSTSP